MKAFNVAFPKHKIENTVRHFFLGKFEEFETFFFYTSSACKIGTRLPEMPALRSDSQQSVVSAFKTARLSSTDNLRLYISCRKIRIRKMRFIKRYRFRYLSITTREILAKKVRHHYTYHQRSNEPVCCMVNSSNMYIYFF